MPLTTRLKSTLRSLVGKEELDRDLDEELQSYLELLTQEKIDGGMSPEEARREARLELGGVEQVKVQVRENRVGAALDSVLQDIRYSFRALGRRKGLTAAAILILGIGIGATTTLFSTINGVLLRSLPFEAPDQLVIGLKTSDGSLNGPVSRVDYFDYRELNRTFEELALFHDFTTRPTLTGGTGPELVRAMRVTWNVFPALRVTPALGRPFLPEDERQGGRQGILISHGFWQRHFGGSTGAIGSALDLDGSTVVILGVMPEGFRFMHPTDVWGLIDRDGPYDDTRDSHSFTVIGRLKPGVSREQAQSDLDAISTGLEQEYPDTNAGKGLALLGLHEAMVGNVRLSLLLLMATALLVLMIACGNVASLLLARGQQRLPEMALRTALGAPRGRLVRQLLTESVILSLLAGAAGIAVAFQIQGLLLQLVPLESTGIAPPAIDGAALVFALAVSVCTGLVVGVVPALRVAGVNPSPQLKTGTQLRGPPEHAPAGRPRGLPGSRLHRPPGRRRTADPQPDPPDAGGPGLRSRPSPHRHRPDHRRGLPHHGAAPPLLLDAHRGDRGPARRGVRVPGVQAPGSRPLAGLADLACRGPPAGSSGQLLRHGPLGVSGLLRHRGHPPPEGTGDLGRRHPRVPAGGGAQRGHRTRALPRWRAARPEREARLDRRPLPGDRRGGRRPAERPSPVTRRGLLRCGRTDGGLRDHAGHPAPGRGPHPGRPGASRGIAGRPPAREGPERPPHRSGPDAVRGQRGAGRLPGRHPVAGPLLGCGPPPDRHRSVRRPRLPRTSGPTRSPSASPWARLKWRS